MRYQNDCVNVKLNDIMKLERMDTTATADIVPNFEQNFEIGASFIYSTDETISQSISLNGNPVPLTSTFAAEPTVLVHAFMKLGYDVHISKVEVTFHEVDVNGQSY